jgi:antitoxin VapB
MRSDAAKTARIFMNGGSQAVRLPAEFRFDVPEVYVRRDPRTGDVVLSSRPAKSWSDFFELRDKDPSVVPDDFLADRSAVPQERDPFSDWKE